MATTNENFDKISQTYLFVEVARRTKAFMDKNPGTRLLKLSIGNTTEPLAPSVIKGLRLGVDKLSDAKTYTGYGDEQGDTRLRKALAQYYQRKFNISLEPEDIFVSDGAKPDSSNIQSLFGSKSIVAVQDPTYPVYVDSNVIAGRTGAMKGTYYDGIVYMPCTQENGFFPSLPKKKVDIIYLCSPNNPTGAAATKEQLKTFVGYARKNGAVIIFDAAYQAFITDPKIPRSIYQIEGSRECAIEINSFSKSSGFTGVRLGWSVVPKSLVVENTQPGKINSLWNRRQTTMFNGASNIAQEGGLAAISDQGLAQGQKVIDVYMENAKTIKKCFVHKGLKIFGGVNCPYLWLKTPDGMKSWDFFDKMLSETNVVITPGVGFGPSGEGYMRISAFGHKEDIKAAVESVNKNLKV